MIGYPYCGYYDYYPYAYLSSRYDCDYYGGYYVRFGPCRASYYVSCSGCGLHDYAHHHVHVMDCGEHGYHHYHVRDCALCYPGGTYVYEDVEVPEVREAVPVASEDRGPGDAPLVEAGPGPAPAGAATTGEAEAASLVPESEAVRPAGYFDLLRPAQLSVALGMISFRQGDYPQAVESFFNASLEDPDSNLVKVLLGASLFSVGEFSFSAEYLRQGLKDWESFPRHPLRLDRLYADADQLAQHRALLQQEIALRPNETDTLLVGAFVASACDRPAEAADLLGRLRSLPLNPVDDRVVAAFAAPYEERAGFASAGGREGPDVDSQSPSQDAFLENPSLVELVDLPIQ